MKIWLIYLFLLIFLIISIILIYICVIRNKSYYIKKNVKAPPHLTKLKKSKHYMSLTAISHPDLPENKKFLENQVPTRKSPYNYSTIKIPDRYKTSFDVRWKWPNCMPPAGRYRPGTPGTDRQSRVVLAMRQTSAALTLRYAPPFAGKTPAPPRASQTGCPGHPGYAR